MRSLIPVLILVSTFLCSCKENGKKPSETATTVAKPAVAAVPESSLDKAATTELMNMITTYYNLKEALVATNGSEADKNASKLMWAGEQFKASVASSPQNAELLSLTKTVIGKSDAISSSKPDSIEYKRAQFAEISDAIYKIATTTKLRHAGVYHAYCPMAFDNKGAYWLSAESEIKNPYFGKKMMDCGEVRDSL